MRCNIPLLACRLTTPIFLVSISVLSNVHRNKFVVIAEKTIDITANYWDRNSWCSIGLSTRSQSHHSSAPPSQDFLRLPILGKWLAGGLQTQRLLSACVTLCPTRSGAWRLYAFVGCTMIQGDANLSEKSKMII